MSSSSTLMTKTSFDPLLGQRLALYKSDSEPSPIVSIALREIAKQASLLDRMIKFVLTLFSWKWVELKSENSDLLLNVNSVIKRVGLTRQQVHEFYKAGTLLEQIKAKVEILIPPPTSGPPLLVSTSMLPGTPAPVSLPQYVAGSRIAIKNSAIISALTAFGPMPPTTSYFFKRAESNSLPLTAVDPDPETDNPISSAYIGYYYILGNTTHTAPSNWTTDLSAVRIIASSRGKAVIQEIADDSIKAEVFAEFQALLVQTSA